MTQSLNGHINDSLKDFCQSYANILVECEDDTPAIVDDCLTSLANTIRKVRLTGSKIYLLIDEYDAIARVTPLAMNGVTSGFNVRHDLTLLPRSKHLLGSMRRIFGERSRKFSDMSEDQKQTINSHVDQMREYYNGYRFAPIKNNDVYNTIYSTNLCLDYLQRLLKGDPLELADSNNGLNEGVLQFIGRHPDSLFLLAGLLENKETSCADIKSGIKLADLTNVEKMDKDHLKSFLFYVGGLTFSSSRDKFVVPNAVMTKAIIERVLQLCSISTNSDAHKEAIKNFFDSDDVEVPVPVVTSKRHYTTNEYIDLPLVETKPGQGKTPKRIVFEFKCKGVKFLDCGVGGMGSWEATEERASHIASLMDEELMGIKCDVSDKNDHGKTMKQLLDNAAEKLKG
ncbi:hypothetical protein BGZ80_004683, partial [Entomortierella chlamydospora]